MLGCRLTFLRRSRTALWDTDHSTLSNVQFGLKLDTGSTCQGGPLSRWAALRAMCHSTRGALWACAAECLGEELSGEGLLQQEGLCVKVFALVSVYGIRILLAMPQVFSR